MLSILLTSDEEGEGIYGTKFMLEELKKRDLLPHSCIVAEPTSINRTGDMLKIGRRGSINGTLIIEGKQGHVAYPQKCINPIELLGSKLGALAGIELDNGDSHFAPSKLVITDIRSGMEVVNVTPQNLKIMFNVRNSPLSNEDSIRTYIKEVFKEIPYELSLKTNSLPFITDSQSALIALLRESIKRVADITPSLSTSGGTSDARFFAQYGIDVVELVYGYSQCRNRLVSHRTGSPLEYLIRDEIIEGSKAECYLPFVVVPINVCTLLYGSA